MEGRSKGGERIPSVGLFSRCLQRAGLDQAKVRSQEISECAM